MLEKLKKKKKKKKNNNFTNKFNYIYSNNITYFYISESGVTTVEVSVMEMEEQALDG